MLQCCSYHLNILRKNEKLKKIREFYNKNLDQKIIKQNIKNEIPGVYAYPIQIRNRDKIKTQLDKKN